MDLTALSAIVLGKMIRSKKISCEELMQAYLTRIAEVNPKINAVVQQLSPEEALKQARDADSLVAKQDRLGKLHGIPIMTKDGHKVKGLKNSLGVDSSLNTVATKDATFVSRLRQEGAIVLGVTNVPAFLMSFETENVLYGRTNNPYDLSRTAGGSSGGLAAIIAAGGCVLGVATDAAGSIRQPAHYCGLVGLKASRGLIPQSGKFPSEGSGLMSPLIMMGPLSRYVDDATLTLQIIAGPDGIDPDALPISLGDPNAVNLKNLRVAYYLDNGIAAPDAETIVTINEVIKALSPEVASVKEDCPSQIKLMHPLIEETYFYGGDKGKWLDKLIEMMQVSQLSHDLQQFIERAKQIEFSITDLRRRLFELDQIRYGMMEFISKYDIIICPAFSSPAKKHREHHTFQNGADFSFNLPYNFTGWPAAVVRCGTSKEGLPIGVQIVAKSYRDDVVLRVAKRLEELFGGWQPPPI